MTRMKWDTVGAKKGLSYQKTLLVAYLSQTPGFYKNYHRKELRVENDPTLFSHTN